jgi:hypothetical protein
MAQVLAYPIKPAIVTQPFGANPEYYARFKDPLGNPEKGHMGVDFKAYHGQPVYAPCKGKAVYKVDSHGGEGIYIYSGDTCYILWHLIGKSDSKYPSPIPTDGSLVDVFPGQVIGFADNTGAPFESSGDHLHFGKIKVNSLKLPLNPGNGFGGCEDSMPDFDGSYSEDQKVGFLQQKLREIKELFNKLYKL